MTTPKAETPTIREELDAMIDAIARFIVPDGVTWEFVHSRYTPPGCIYVMPVRADEPNHLLIACTQSLGEQQQLSAVEMYLRKRDTPPEPSDVR